jgi:hypothetical protein
LIVVLALTAAVVVTVAVTFLLVLSNRGDALGARPDWQPPPQTLLTSSMRVQPVPGWKARINDLGLPDQSRIATSDDPIWSSPFIGYLDNRGYFLATSPGTPDKQWWMVGVDAHSGGRLFAPVRLDAGAGTPKCFLNGPNTVLCLVDNVHDGVAQPSTAWVIDARTGTVSFTGPTDLFTSPGELRVQQVGIYALAGTADKGVYGVGPDAEPTWFVPGRGTVSARPLAGTDAAPLVLATQSTGQGSDRMIVFSIIDGAVITPQVAHGEQPLSAAVYPGGFAVEVAAAERQSASGGVEFFDAKGERLGRADVSGSLSTLGTDLPTMESNPQSTVFGASGAKLAEIPGSNTGGSSLLVGSRLFVEVSDGETRWQQYDLSTGVQGKSCAPYMGAYVGSDGTTGILESGNPNIGLVTTAMDLATCDTLWTLKSPIGSFRDVWRVNTTLVQLSDDGTELMSLVAPS